MTPVTMHLDAKLRHQHGQAHCPDSPKLAVFPPETLSLLILLWNHEFLTHCF